MFQTQQLGFFPELESEVPELATRKALPRQKLAPNQTSLWIFSSLLMYLRNIRYIIQLDRCKCISVGIYTRGNNVSWEDNGRRIEDQGFFFLENRVIHWLMSEERVLWEERTKFCDMEGLKVMSTKRRDFMIISSSCVWHSKGFSHFVFGM